MSIYCKYIKEKGKMEMGKTKSVEKCGSGKKSARVKVNELATPNKH
jgi:hypothetical protein